MRWRKVKTCNANLQYHKGKIPAPTCLVVIKCQKNVNACFDWLSFRIPHACSTLLPRGNQQDYEQLLAVRAEKQTELQEALVWSQCHLQQNDSVTLTGHLKGTHMTATTMTSLRSWTADVAGLRVEELFYILCNVHILKLSFFPEYFREFWKRFKLKTVALFWKLEVILVCFFIIASPKHWTCPIMHLACCRCGLS